MRRDETGFADRAGELGRAFDRSFAEAPRQGAEASVDLLAIRVGGDPYALSLGEVGGLFVDRKVTPLPTLVPELLGLAGFRAALVPVYDLRALLGYPSAGLPRWMVSTAGDASDARVCLAFDEFEAHLRVPRAALAADDARAKNHVRQIARTSDGARSVIHLASVLDTIVARARSVSRPKER